MSTQEKTQSINISGIPAELVKLLDERVNERHLSGRSAYIRDLIQKDLLIAKPNPNLSSRSRITPKEAEAIFAEIEEHFSQPNRPIEPGTDSREAIYGERA